MDRAAAGWGDLLERTGPGDTVRHALGRVLTAGREPMGYSILATAARNWKPGSRTNYSTYLKKLALRHPGPAHVGLGSTVSDLLTGFGNTGSTAGAKGLVSAVRLLERQELIPVTITPLHWCMARGIQNSQVQRVQH